MDAEEGAGVENVLDRAVDNVAAGVGPCGDGNRLSNSVKKRQAMAGSGWEAAAVVGRLGGGGAVRRGCDHAATSSAVLLRSWVVPQIQFIDRVDGVRDGVLLVLSSVVHRDRYPQCFLGVVVLGTERGCSMEACERISHIFYVLLALFAWNLDLIS